jgi:hypothetical protein
MQARGGWLAAYSTGAEQLAVESTLSPPEAYWIGVELQGGSQWVLLDASGAGVGDGRPSNGDPYAHW